MPLTVGTIQIQWKVTLQVIVFVCSAVSELSFFGYCHHYFTQFFLRGIFGGRFLLGGGWHPPPKQNHIGSAVGKIMRYTQTDRQTSCYFIIMIMLFQVKTAVYMNVLAKLLANKYLLKLRYATLHWLFLTRNGAISHLFKKNEFWI